MDCRKWWIYNHSRIPRDSLSSGDHEDFNSCFVKSESQIKAETQAEDSVWVSNWIEVTSGRSVYNF